MFSRVIVPLDGSPLAQSALPYALALTDASGASLTLLQVVEPLTSTLDFDVQYDAAREAAALAHANDTLVPLAQALHEGGRHVESEVLLGNPPLEILRFADRGDADLVVMATHGRGGVLHWAFGSVARKVLLASDTPLLIVRPSEAPKEPENPASIRSILVPLDGSERAEMVLPLVTEIAQRCKASVTLIHVVPPLPSVYIVSPYMTPTELAYLDESAQAMKASATTRLNANAERINTTGVKADAVVQTGQASEILLETIADNGYDLVAMTTHGRTGFQRWMLGSVAERIIEHSHTPVLLVRTGRDAE